MSRGPEQLLKVEFTTAVAKDLMIGDSLLGFALGEVQAIVNRAPHEDLAIVNNSKKIIIAIFTED